ncbi:MAG: endo-1,4-beta-xylanase [Kiritimatiellaeota bacterium]|nr:endo-1,4-beta-xylanase [Kiritimatiellota bacterium]
MDKYLSILLLALGAGLIASASPPVAFHNDKAPFDPSKGLKDYAGETIIGSKSSANGRSDCVIEGEYAEKSAGLHLRNCTGLQVQVYPSFQGSWPDAAPETLEKLTFQTEGLSALVNWGREHQQETLHHLMIGPNQYFPEWFWKNKYTAGELDQLLKRYITTLLTANDNKCKMDGWNIFNEMLFHKEDGGGYKKDGSGRGNCVWMRMGFEADQSGLTGKAKINEQHPVVFRKALQYAAMASGKLEIRESRVEEINRKSDALYQLIKHLLNSGVRVDAVGFQGHLDVNRSYDWDSIKKNIRRFKDLGLEVYITELDVSMGMGWKTGNPFPKSYEKLQAERFNGLVKAAREAGVHRIDVWGLSEAVNQHWLVGQKARLFDEQFQPRPTYQAVLKALYDTQPAKP